MFGLISRVEGGKGRGTRGRAEVVTYWSTLQANRGGYNVETLAAWKRDADRRERGETKEQRATPTSRGAICIDNDAFALGRSI